jgi:putative acetyltransferase
MTDAPSAIAIRAERAEDLPGIREVNVAAFETPLEADLVEALRARARPLVSLVAVDGAEIVGHTLFSPVTLLSHPDEPIMGLAPMAVAPARQRQGIGSALVRAGLEECRRQGAHAVVVLGHADYYPRFGFVPASTFGLRSEYEVPDDVFMALELDAGALHQRAGTIRYHPAFADA